MQYPRNLLVKNNQSLQIKIEKEKLTDEYFTARTAGGCNRLLVFVRPEGC